eukprot:m51a1_g6205 hypothetical protein (102) ;mRNA; f:139223-139528
MANVLVLRVKFPQSYPIIYKTVRLGGEVLVRDALSTIATQCHVDHITDASHCCLYLPPTGTVLEDERPLGHYTDALRDESLECVEYRLRDSLKPKKKCEIL